MAQKAHLLILAVALALPCVALAGEDRDHHERHAPIVLNGLLHTYDFTGGVGYSSGSFMYVQGYSYGAANSGSSSFTATQGFVAGARASAFAAASAGSGHR
jgi:hypothetical protein